MTDIMTPALGESVTEATVARWSKKPGEAVKRDDILVELETDKVSLEVVGHRRRRSQRHRRRGGRDGHAGPAAGHAQRGRRRVAGQGRAREDGTSQGRAGQG